jgi:predicted nucleotidyltransferase
MTLSPDFREFVRLLNERSVRYLVVGGYAVAVHGHPRYTKDLDVWIDAVPENVRRLLDALEDFGFGELGLTEDDFLEPETVVQLGRPPNRIDLVTELDGVVFENCFDDRSVVEIEGLPVSFIGLEKLRENKRASGRHQDLADLESLEDAEPS